MEQPENIGKYEITGVAGKGAMGVVYIGHDPFVDRSVAIKVSTQMELDNTGDVSTQARKMFFNEAQAAGALDHPNILKIFDAGEADKQPYIVMEFVDKARTFKEYCGKDSLLPPREVLEYMKQCAEALDYAHQQGITHRDIKPANILLTQDNQVKIADFGIAQRNRADATQVMGWFGSPLYMSPEQARDESITPRSDLFSLGVVTYELLTGVSPFSAKGISGLLHNVLNKDPEPVHEVRAELPPAVNDFLVKALQKDPDKRFQTGNEFAVAIGHLLLSLDDPLLSMSDEEKLLKVKELRFFKDFSSAEIQEFLRVAKWERYPAGQPVISEGEDDPTLFVIASGEASVSRSGTVVATVDEGDSIGEIAYLLGGKRSATVTAVTDVLVLAVAQPLKEWAPLPLQMRLSKLFQHVLAERLISTTRRLAGRLN